MTPFVRMIGGLVDYTPGAFENATRENFEARFEKPMAMVRAAHTLGNLRRLRVALPNGIRLAERYKGDPSFEFIKKIPLELG